MTLHSHADALDHALGSLPHYEPDGVRSKRLRTVAHRRMRTLAHRQLTQRTTRAWLVVQYGFVSIAATLYIIDVLRLAVSLLTP